MADRVVVMNHGVIEQVGTPQQIYRDPKSLFVADFVGAMTFLDGTMTDATTVAVDGLALAVTDARGAPAGAKVRVGIRPEDVAVGAAAGANAFEAEVAGLEFLGALTRARLAPAGRAGPIFLADLPAGAAARRSAQPGARLAAMLPPPAVRDAPAG